MTTPADTLACMRAVKVVPVLRAGRIEAALTAAEWLAEAGMSVIELTFTTPGILEGISELCRRKGILVGAGTVLSRADARAAITAGAHFLVTPCWVDGIIEQAQASGLAALIGTANPSEIWRAHSAGATAVKVFPAAMLGGPSYLNQVRAVFPHVPMMPTGGIALADVKDYLAAGSVCVGLGSELAPAKAIEAGDKAAILDRAQRLLASLASPPAISV